MALQRPSHFIVFRDDGVYKHPLMADPDHLPRGTWALSNSNDVAKQPCVAFLEAATQQIARIIQATSPLEDRWKAWSKERGAVKFVMNHFSIEEMTALGLVRHLQVFTVR